MTPAYLEYAHDKNPYGIKAISKISKEVGDEMFEGEDGCRERILECRRLAKLLDKDSRGDNKEVNRACSDANALCDHIRGIFRVSGRLDFYKILQFLWSNGVQELLRHSP